MTTNAVPHAEGESWDDLGEHLEEPAMNTRELKAVKNPSRPDEQFVVLCVFQLNHSFALRCASPIGFLER